MFHFSSIEQYHAQLNEGVTSCVQATRHYLEKISSASHLNAFLRVFGDEALERAALLDRNRKAGHPPGKMHGVIAGIKDVICYKDHPVTAASRILNNFESVYSATVVERMLAEDAIIIGMLNCDEFAMGSTNENSAYGKVLNAIDESRIPGGSSGGSAVAVQAGLCMVSLGTDTGGSVRQPANYCGIIGFKPGYGTISRYGIIAYASSFDQVGIFGMSIPDIAIVLEVIGGADEYDSTVSHRKQPEYRKLLSVTPGKYRFAYFPEALEHPSLDREIASSIRGLMESLKNGGHVVEEVNFEFLDYIVPAYYVLTTAEASSNLSRYDGVRYGLRADEAKSSLTEFYETNRSQGFGNEVKRRIMLGTFVLSAGYYDAYFNQAQQVRRMLVEKTKLIFNEFDFLILPTSPSTAHRFGEHASDPISIYLADIFTVYANLTGIPGISLPVFKHSNNLPFGLQLLSPRFNELSLLRISNQLMQRNLAEF